MFHCLDHVKIYIGWTKTFEALLIGWTKTFKTSNFQNIEQFFVLEIRFKRVHNPNHDSNCKYEMNQKKSECSSLSKFWHKN